MCFTTSIFNTKKIAKEDIICFKGGYIIDEKFHPLWFGRYFYLKAYLQPKIKLHKKNNMFVAFDICEGYHSYKSYKNEVTNHCSYMAKFIIPKGTVYYEKRKEYVSETIKWIG